MSDLRERPAVDAPTQRRLAGAVTGCAGLGMVLFTFVPWIRFGPGLHPHTHGLPPVLDRGWALHGGVNPALWTVVLGALLTACGLALWTGAANTLLTRLGVLTAAVALVAVCVFTANPQAAFGLHEAAYPFPDALVTAAWGLWVVFACALFAVAATLSAALLEPVDAAASAPR